MKKILTIILAVAALLSAAAPMAFAESLNPYEFISTLSFDHSEEALKEGKQGEGLQEKADYVGDFWGAGLVYRNVDFGNMTPSTMILNAGSMENPIVDFRLDSMDGPIFATVQVVSTGAWGTQKSFEAKINMKIEGVHDIWLVNRPVGNGRFFSFKIIPAEYDRTPLVLYDGTENYTEELSGEDKFYCDLIGGLGFKSGQGDTIDPNLTVSRGTFASFIDWVMNYFNNGERYFTDVADNYVHYEAITRLKSYNIISGYDDMTFRPDQAITGDEAATICVNALGYNKYSAGDYNFKKAKLMSQSGIKKVTEPISTLEAMKLIYQFLKSDYVYMDISGAESYELYEKKNILEYTRNIYLETNVIEGNVFSMIDNPSESTEGGQVVIRGETFNTSNSGAERFLGRKCEYFVYRDKDADYPEILSIAIDKKSASIKIDHKTEPYIENGTLYYEDNNKTKKITLSQNTQVIYNSAAYENIDISQLLNMQNMKYENGAWVSNGKEKREFKGTIEAVDYNGGTNADVLFVNYFEDIVVSGYDESGMLLRNKLSDNAYYITGKEDKSYSTIFLDGESVSYRVLEPDMVGIIYQSINNDGKCIVTAYFTTESIEGKINSKSSDKLTINSEEYDVSADLLKTKDIYIGMTGKFYLNPFNEVMWVVTGDTASNERLVLYIRGGYSEENEEVCITVWDKEENCLKQYSVMEKINLEGVRTKSYDQVMNGAGGYTNIGVSSLKKGYLLKIKTNDQGKVTYIDSQLTGAKNEKDCVKMISASIDGEQLIYRWEPKLFGSDLEGNKYPFRDDTIMITAPNLSSDEFSIGQDFRVDPINTLNEEDQTREFVLFSTEYETSIASTVIYYKNKKVEYDKYSLYVFEESDGRILGRNDETCQTVVLNNSGMSKNYVVSQDYSKNVDFSAFVPGTLLRVALNSYNEISSVEKVFVPNSDEGTVNEQNPENETYMNSSLRVLLAEVAERDDNFIRLKKKKGEMAVSEYVNTDDILVFTCKTANRRAVIEASDASALTVGKKALFILDYGRVKQAIIY